VPGRFASFAVIVSCACLSGGCSQKAPPAPAKSATPGPTTAAGPSTASPTPSKTSNASAKSESGGTVAKTATDPGSATKTATAVKPAGPEVQAQEFVDALAAGEFDKATRDFDDTMAKVMPAAKLKETWAGVEKQAGKFTSRGASRTEKAKAKDSELDITIITCDFEKSALDIRIVCNKDSKVAGLFFAPAKPAFVGKEELWLGQLSTGGVTLRLLVHLGKTADGKYAATLDSLDQRTKGIPFDEVTYANGKVRLEAKALKIVFDGKIGSTGRELSGEWQQGGTAIPLTFKQVDSEP
jgi:hypothetical protein